MSVFALNDQGGFANRPKYYQFSVPGCTFFCFPSLSGHWYQHDGFLLQDCGGRTGGLRQHIMVLKNVQISMDSLATVVATLSTSRFGSGGFGSRPLNFAVL